MLTQPICSDVVRPLTSAVTAVPGGVFSPFDLFTGGQQGGWWDPSDTSSLFQDSAGTTPVTASGQPVGMMRDKSGRGNHLLQPVGLSRPIYTEAGGLRFLQFDGVDDFLSVASANMSATDEVFLSAGVRKLSDAAASVLVELSVTSVSNPGTFALLPSVAGAMYSTRAGGTISTNANTATTYVAPITNVLRMAVDISSDVQTLHVNGASAASTAADQGTGNMGAAYPLFVGARAGTSLFYSGQLHGLILRGSIPIAAQIASTDRYHAGKAGISF